MKLLRTVLSAAALTGVMALPVSADDAKEAKDLKKVIEDQGINYVETAQKGITLSGYVDVSYTNQFGGRGTGFGSGQAQLRQFDTQNNNFNLNAVKIALEKALPDKNTWAAGFRIDTFFGADARSIGDSAFQTVSATPVGGGNALATNGSGFALEQALVKFRIPVGNGLDVYAGKFVSFLGYEVFESPANLNFSRGLLFTNAIPATHTGVYADYKFNDTFEAKLGVVDGWNNSISPTSKDVAADYPFGGKAVTGQLNINAPGKNANITQSFIYSPSGEPGVATASGDNGPVFVYDIWGNWNPTFIKDSALTLGFNVDFGYNGATGTNFANEPGFGSGSGTVNTPVMDSNTWYGLALYASYKFNKIFTLSGRGEYLHSDPAQFPKFGANALTTELSQDDYSYTLTASFNIWDNLLTRAEYRFDDFSAGTTGTGDSTTQNEVSLEAVYSF